MKKYIITGIFFIAWVYSVIYAAPPEVKNVKVTQGDAGGLIHIYYDLIGPDGNNNFKVTIKVSDDGGKNFDISPKKVSGDVGERVIGGNGKHIVWDASSDVKKHNLKEYVGTAFVVAVIAEEKAREQEEVKKQDEGTKKQEVQKKQEDVKKYAEQEEENWEVKVRAREQQDKQEEEKRKEEAKKQDEQGEAKKQEESNKNKLVRISYELMVYIPAGEFVMGSDTGNSDEKPVRKVYLDAYYIDKYEVTFEQYDRFCEATNRKKPDDSGWGRGKRPAINVNWDDAVAYCAWAGKRLPTEAEWEKACREVSTGQYLFLGEYAWYGGNSGRITSPVGTKKPNYWGIYDMHGNVWEWCSDWYGKNYYKKSPYQNPKGPDSGIYRVQRGGSWNDNGDLCRSEGRGMSNFDYGCDTVGFRCAVGVKTPEIR